MNHYMPVNLFAGDHSVKKNSGIFSTLGSRCLIVTGHSSAVKSGALNDVKDVLTDSNISFQVFDGIRQNPTVASCIQAGHFAHKISADFIIGIGGGSALDAAKATAVFAANPELDESGFYRVNWPFSPLPILLVGTTAGTGSEVTKVSVLTDAQNRKHSIHDDRIFAAYAFGDPRYTTALPRSVTLSTGIDVLSHCAESYFSRKADDLSRAYAVCGIRLLYGPLLEAAAKDKLSLLQREQLYNASILGGLAICSTGTCFPHNVGYYLTENYGIPHGFASAVFLPDLLTIVTQKAPEYTDRFFRELGISRNDLLHLTKCCLPDTGIIMTENEIVNALPRWENSSSVQNTCCAVSTAEIKDILKNHFSI